MKVLDALEDVDLAPLLLGKANEEDHETQLPPHPSHQSELAGR